MNSRLAKIEKRKFEKNENEKNWIEKMNTSQRGKIIPLKNAWGLYIALCNAW